MLSSRVLSNICVNCYNSILLFVVTRMYHQVARLTTSLRQDLGSLPLTASSADYALADMSVRYTQLLQQLVCRFCSIRLSKAWIE